MKTLLSATALVLLVSSLSLADGPGWHEEAGRYVCQWLDSTGGGGLVDGAFGHAVREGDSLPFVFNTGPDTAILNTFSYHKDRDVWTMAIDNQRGGERREFARVTLARP